MLYGYGKLPGQEDTQVVEKPIVSEEEKIWRWRVDRLIHAGAPKSYADRLAKDPNLDLHLACKVLQSTDLETALDILL